MLTKGFTGNPTFLPQPADLIRCTLRITWKQQYKNILEQRYTKILLNNADINVAEIINISFDVNLWTVGFEVYHFRH